MDLGRILAFRFRDDTYKTDNRNNVPGFPITYNTTAMSIDAMAKSCRMSAWMAMLHGRALCPRIVVKLLAAPVACILDSTQICCC
jgi:hypothetical protein